jgi:hypothetical protein
MPANMPRPRPDGLVERAAAPGAVTSGRISLPSGATCRLRMLTLTSQAANHHP